MKCITTLFSIDFFRCFGFRVDVVDGRGKSRV